MIHREGFKAFVVRVFVVCICFAPLTYSAFGQLISPGKLSAAHADLQGITKCTSCHELGQRSSSNTLCLDCHTPLQTRINANEGFHSTVKSENCADCHKEHFGVEFVLVRLDTLAFDHGDTGFDLRGSHQEASCRGCHIPENIIAADVRRFKGDHNALDKTFLGLDTTCIGCHVEESPHQNQFPEVECSTCHEEEEWEEAPVFNHDDARFTLIGEHQNVECESCHATERTPAGEEFVRYVNLEFGNCSSCHEDAHDGGFGADCSSCHSPNGWGEISKDLTNSREFDHESTGFSLIGAHASATCSSCHGKPARRDSEFRVTFIGSTDRNSFPRMQSDNCLSCHVDYHNGEFRDTPGGGAICENCHGQHEWFPTSYDIQRHNAEADFELTGAHMATPCVGCHANSNNDYSFEIPETECQDCHQEDNPHGEQFAEANQVTVCENCHVTDAWEQASNSFDHDQTDFPLTGQHIQTDCVSCHVEETLASGEIVQVFSGLENTCESCHNEDDPHQGQFNGTECATCHNTDAFTITDFNHDDTRFPLTGSHIEVDCQHCHLEESAPDASLFIRYTPVPRKCEDCHGEE